MPPESCNHVSLPIKYITKNRLPNLLFKLFLTYGRITFALNKPLSHPVSERNKNIITLYKVFFDIGWFIKPYIYIIYTICTKGIRKILSFIIYFVLLPTARTRVITDMKFFALHCLNHIISHIINFILV